MPGLEKEQRPVPALFLLLTVTTSLSWPVPDARAESPYQSSKVQAVLASMTPEERVGQLFLVTLQGTNTASDSQIYDLISRHHVGGVVLLKENDNFVAGPDTINGAHRLVSSLANDRSAGKYGNARAREPNQ